MSDAPETRRGATAPLPMTVQPSTDPMPNAPPIPAGRVATQMSASAVPSTLESPQDDAAGGAAPPPASPVAPVAMKHDVTAQDDAARRNAELDTGAAAPPIVSSGRGGPATLMSPAVAPLGDKPASPSLAPEDAVIDVGAPAHAFMPHGSSPAYGGGPGMMHQGPHAGGGASGRRPMSTTTLAMLVVGGVVGIIVLAGLVVGLFYLAERRKAEAAESTRAQRGPTAAAPPAAAEGPRTPPRFGGTKARLAVTSGGALDPEAVRAALAGALPRVDACFAAAELEPPSHESVAYDLDAQPSGEVKKVELVAAASRAPKLDACVVQALKVVRLPKAARPSVVKLTFSAPLDVH